LGTRNGFPQLGQKLQKLVKNTEGILGVKPLINEAFADSNCLCNFVKIELYLSPKVLYNRIQSNLLQ
jgi:hypothetical protein